MDSTYILLQHYWWFLVSLLGALLVFLLFVQGGQSLLFTIGKTELQQKMLLNSTGRKWEFTFTTLLCSTLISIKTKAWLYSFRCTIGIGLFYEV